MAKQKPSFAEIADLAHISNKEIKGDTSTKKLSDNQGSALDHLQKE